MTIDLFARCPRCGHTLFHLQTTRRVSYDPHIVCASLVCEACHNEYDLLASGELELTREPGLEENGIAGLSPQ